MTNITICQDLRETMLYKKRSRVALRATRLYAKGSRETSSQDLKVQNFREADTPRSEL